MLFGGTRRMLESLRGDQMQVPAQLALLLQTACWGVGRAKWTPDEMKQVCRMKQVLFVCADGLCGPISCAWVDIWHYADSCSCLAHFFR